MSQWITDIRGPSLKKHYSFTQSRTKKGEKKLGWRNWSVWGDLRLCRTNLKKKKEQRYRIRTYAERKWGLLKIEYSVIHRHIKLVIGLTVLLDSLPDLLTCAVRVYLAWMQFVFILSGKKKFVKISRLLIKCGQSV